MSNKGRLIGPSPSLFYIQLMTGFEGKVASTRLCNTVINTPVSAQGKKYIP